MPEALARRLTGLSAEDVARAAVGSKSIRWSTAQLIRPMESVVPDPPMAPDPIWQVLSSRDGDCTEGAARKEARTERTDRPLLLVAGDMMCQSSFLGCVASANAAAHVVIEEAEARGRPVG